MIEKQKILIVDDNKIDRKILSHVLGNNYLITEASNGIEAFELLENKKEDFSLILLDLFMPLMNGFDLLKKISKSKITNVPIIVLTGDDRVESIYEALDLGATSIFPKPIDTKKLLNKVKVTIESYVNSLTLNDDDYSVYNSLNQMKKEQQIDLLTGLFNYDAFNIVASSLIKENPNKTFTIVRSDFNRFKLVNEVYGREVGDKLLQDYAKYVIQILGKSAVVTRLAADMFVALVDKSRENLKFDMLLIDEFLLNYPIDINLSLVYGIYCINDNKHLDIDRMVDRAGYALNRAKNSLESGSYVVYNENLDKFVQIEQAVIYGIESAIKKGEIIVYFQPKYSLVDRRVVGAEALVRWNHPKFGMLSPGVFIPILEANGLIHMLDYYVWDQTCAAVARWRKDTSLPKIPVSVNISRNNFYRENIWIELLKLIDKYGLTTDCINVEITETSYMKDPKLIQSVVNKFKEVGLSVHMDDFGTGLSSLNILKDLVFDVLKIDLNFLQGLESNERAAIILKSIVNMNKLLKMPVVAEGIETVEQENFLRDIGCEVGQGFLFSKPVDEQQFLKLLRQNTNNILLKKAN